MVGRYCKRLFGGADSEWSMRGSLKSHLDSKSSDKEKISLVVEAHIVLSDSRCPERFDMGEDGDGMGDGVNGIGGMGEKGLPRLFAQFQLQQFGSGCGGHSHSRGGGRPFPSYFHPCFLFFSLVFTAFPSFP